MAKEIPEEEVLLVHDKEDKRIKAVKGIDKQGKLQTVEPKKENNSEFLKINKHDGPLENFLSNFKRQLKNPTRFTFFFTRSQAVEETAQALAESIQKKSTNDHQKQKSMETPTPGTETQYRFNPDKINWESMNKFGITQENLSQNTLENMLKGNKSAELHRISADFGHVKLQTEARLAFRNMPDGSVSLSIHGVRKEPELDKPFFGHQFTDEDKRHLLETGNMGRLAETKDYRTGETNLAYISLDKLTNELVAMKAEHIRLPEKIKGVKLDEEQKQWLHEGKAVFVEGMTSKTGKEFSAYLQINADKRAIEFRFDNSPKEDQSNKQIHGVFIPQKMGGVALSKEQQKDLKEGKTVYIENMTDKKGEQYSAYVKVNAEKGKLEFYAKNPDIAQKEGKTRSVKPDNRHKAQVNANNEGKKSESNKNVDEPFKKGETQKAKGHKM